MSDFYRRKLYALLPEPEEYSHLKCWGENGNFAQIADWWRQNGRLIEEIASSSDRVNLTIDSPNSDEGVLIKHPISGQEDRLQLTNNTKPLKIPPSIEDETDPKKVFWWFWRFYPEWCVKEKCSTAP